VIEDDFYATLKLKTGEEIFCKVAATEEDDRTLLLVSNPIIVSEIKSKNGVVGYKIEPWLKTTTDNMFILNLEDILTMSESTDIEMITMHQSFSKEYDTKTMGGNEKKIDRKMGYISSVNDAKEILEKIFKNS